MKDSIPAGEVPGPPDGTQFWAVVRTNAGHVCAAITSVVTFVLLFQPWLTAAGPNGTATSNAFGHIHASTRYLTIWSSSSSSRMPTAHITGVWALLTIAAVVVTVATVALNLRARSRVFARLATGSSAAVAVFVLCALVYINSKSGELKAMTARRWDMGGQLGSVMSWILGKDKLPLPGTEIVYSSASLAPAGIFACIVSLGGALAAVAQWIFVYSPTSIRRPQRSPADAPASPETDL